MIDTHKALTKEWCRFYNKLDEAEFEARKTHEKRPLPMIAWRNQPMIAEFGIDKCREELLSQPGADYKQVEKNAGTRRRGWRLPSAQASRRCASNTSAPTPLGAVRLCEWPGRNRRRWSGAAALIAYTRRDIMEGEVEWSRSRRSPSRLSE